ncbi:thioesterase family protein [Jatrophihabitans endophyticus]|uniref:thioesterase family protein n=1 Tax=Jatrophihabitans endophyticus TaxID=1206085 RepID=UPI0019E6B226|nr:thioesterase family protein [Jatrophihabitans endophyticus]MBE7187070.1 thioesterase family protein [Jatrophihabitans endophyticus]
MTTRPFAEATALTPAGPGVFDAVADPEWTIGDKPNGGYLLALLGRATVEATAHPHVLAASAHYLRAPDPGPVRIEVEVLRAGRGVSQLRARLTQGGQGCVEALFTNGRLDADAVPYWDAGMPGPGAPDDSGGFRVPGTSPVGFRVPIMDQVEARLDRDTAGFRRGEPSGRGELRGTLSLGDGVDFDPVSLLYAVDAYPPATFEVELTGWVPTLELTAYVRALPAPGPVRVVQRARLIDDRRVDEECLVWDSRGRLVAQCTQLAGIRLG